MSRAANSASVSTPFRRGRDSVVVTDSPRGSARPGGDGRRDSMHHAPAGRKATSGGCLTDRPIPAASPNARLPVSRMREDGMEFQLEPLTEAGRRFVDLAEQHATEFAAGAAERDQDG